LQQELLAIRSGHQPVDAATAALRAARRHELAGDDAQEQHIEQRQPGHLLSLVRLLQLPRAELEGFALEISYRPPPARFDCRAVRD
jgi:hypothetical protein